MVDLVYSSCVVTIGKHEMRVDLLLFNMVEFVILGINWLSVYHTILDCHTIGPTETPDMYSYMNKLNDYLQKLYNYHENLINNAFYTIGNINTNLPSNYASIYATMKEDDSLDSFKIWSTLSFTQTSSRNIDDL